MDAAESGRHLREHYGEITNALECNGCQDWSALWHTRSGRPPHSKPLFHLPIHLCLAHLSLQVKLFHRTSDHTPEGKGISKQLLTIKQGRQQIAWNVVEFSMRVDLSRWSDGFESCISQLTQHRRAHGTGILRWTSITWFPHRPCDPV